jgi:hypothetical protein
MATGVMCLLLLVRAFHKHPEVLRDVRKRLSSRKRLVVAPAPDPASDATSAAANAAEQGQGGMTLDPQTARRNPCVTSRGGAPAPDGQAGAPAAPVSQGGVTATEEDGLVFYEETPRSPTAAR